MRRVHLLIAARAVAFGFVGALAAAAPTRASEIIREPFTYPVGELHGRAGGSGWGGSWSAATAATEVVSPDSPLRYSVPGGATVDGGDRALQLNGNHENAIYRAMSAPVNSADVYVSYLLRFASGTITNNDFAAFWLDNVTTGQHTSIPNFGLKANRGDGSGQDDVMARFRLGVTELYRQNVSVGGTYFVVVHLRKRTPGAANAYDHIDMWVNPALSEGATPHVAGDAMGTLSVFGFVGIRSANLAPGDVLLIDSLTMGTTWSDVVPAGTADLGIVKSDTPDPVPAGQSVTYTVQVTNAGPDAAAAVNLSDPVPSGATFRSLQVPTGWACTTPAVGSGGAIDCSIASLAAGQPAEFRITIDVQPGVAAGTSITNTATIASASTDLQSGNNTATATTLVGPAPTPTPSSTPTSAATPTPTPTEAPTSTATDPQPEGQPQPAPTAVPSTPTPVPTSTVAPTTQPTPPGAPAATSAPVPSTPVPVSPASPQPPGPSPAPLPVATPTPVGVASPTPALPAPAPEPTTRSDVVEAIAAGATAVSVTSTEGFAAGDIVVVFSTPETSEEVQVAGVNTPNTLLLTRPLENSYPAGSGVAVVTPAADVEPAPVQVPKATK